MSQYVVITDFRRGLDTRKSVLTSVPGTLATLQNAHITPGGEIEVRKAFAANAIPAGTFGVQEFPTGIMVFGSDADPGVSTPVLYRRLQHLGEIDGVTEPEAGDYDMTAVLYSALFGGVEFVVASFGDGNAFCYYGGTIVRDFTDGQIFEHHDTLVKIAEAITQLLNRTDSYTAVQGTTPNDNKVTVTGIHGRDYTITSEITSSGTLAIAVTASIEPVQPVDAIGAVGQFRIVQGERRDVGTTQRARASNVATLTTSNPHGLWVGASVVISGVGGTGYNNAAATVASVPSSTSFTYANTGGDEGTTADTGGTVINDNCKITSIKVGASFRVLVEILNTTIQWQVSNNYTAQLVANAINSYNSSPEYTADAVGNVVRIFSAAAQGDTPNQYFMQITGNAPICLGDFAFQFSGTGYTVNDITADEVSILTSGPYALSSYGSQPLLMEAIMRDINENTGTHGYVAYQLGNIVALSRKVTTSEDPAVEILVELNPAGTGIVIYGTTAPGSEFLASLTTTQLYKYTSGDSDVAPSPPLSCNVVGGSQPYTFQWEELPWLSSYGTRDYYYGLGFVAVSDPTAATVTFSKTKGPGSYDHGRVLSFWRCVVTDSTGKTAKSEICHVLFQAEPRF